LPLPAKEVKVNEEQTKAAADPLTWRSNHQLAKDTLVDLCEVLSHSGGEKITILGQNKTCDAFGENCYDL
jgi:hypothetical protein